MLDVFYCVDGADRGRGWLKFSIDSLLRHHKDARVFVASECPFEYKDTVWIDAAPYIERFGMERIQGIVKNGMHPSPMQTFRLATPCLDELKDVGSVLYLDIDTEIVRPGLDELPQGGFDADVMALFEHSQHGKDSTSIMLEDLELRAEMSEHTVNRLKDGGYFNSGVMLMNLSWWRKNHPDWSDDLPHVIDLAVRHHRIVVDQDISNVVLTAVPLAPEFNVMPDTDVQYYVKDPCVVHYANMSKYKTSAYPPPEVRAKLVKSVKT